MVEKLTPNPATGANSSCNAFLSRSASTSNCWGEACGRGRSAARSPPPDVLSLETSLPLPCSAIVGLLGVGGFVVGVGPGRGSLGGIGTVPGGCGDLDLARGG